MEGNSISTWNFFCKSDRLKSFHTPIGGCKTWQLGSQYHKLENDNFQPWTFQSQSTNICCGPQFRSGKGNMENVWSVNANNLTYLLVWNHIHVHRISSHVFGTPQKSTCFWNECMCDCNTHKVCLKNDLHKWKDYSNQLNFVLNFAAHWMASKTFIMGKSFVFLLS